MTRSAVLTPALMRLWAVAAARALAAHAEQINDLNVFPVPDGDTGTNSSLTFRAGLDAIASLPADADITTIARAMGQAAAFGARGNSGVILSQMLRGMLDAAIDPASEIDGTALARILASAADAGREAVADPRDGTMLSVASDAASAALQRARTGGGLAEVSVAAADAARSSLIDTPNHLAELAAAGVVDAGGRAIVVVLDALAETVTGQARDEWQAPILVRNCDLLAAQAAYAGPAYEVMYVLEASAVAVTDVQSQLVNLGDSLAVVGGDGFWNVHVHVDDPASAVAIGRSAGRLHNVRVSYLISTDSHATHVVIAIGVDGDVASLMNDAGIRTVAATHVDEVVEELRSMIALESVESVSLLTSGPLGRFTEQWWRTALPDTPHLGVVTCHQVPQMIAAAAVHDESAPLHTDIANMASAVAGMRCVALTEHSNGVTWSMPDWSSGSASTLSAALEQVMVHLVCAETEIVTVVRTAASSLSASQVESLLIDLAPDCEISILNSSSDSVTLAVGVE